MGSAFAHRVHASAGNKAHGALLRALFAGALFASMVGLASCGLLDDEDVTMGGVSGTNASTAGMRSYYTDTANAKNATVMVYMVGSDLESQAGVASADIEEMAASTVGTNVNLVIETGGSSDWSFSRQASTTTRQRWLVAGGEVQLLGDAGAGTMLDAGEVTDFVNWAAASYPADRYLLFFWDHGGGTVGGFGYDELYPDAPALSLADIRSALDATGEKFDMVGFDACLMGTIETAYALEPCADYLLASEELEPGQGWSWTGFLSALEANPAAPSVDIGTRAIDDFIDHYASQGEYDVTLSLVDLREVPSVYENLGGFLTQAQEAIKADNAKFQELSQARSRATAFAEGQVDQVDLVDLVDRTTFAGKDELKAAVQSCVKYRTQSGIAGANGLALYFPYEAVSSYDGMRTTLQQISYTKPTEFYDYFLSVMGSSTSAYSSSGSGSYSDGAGGAGDGTGDLLDLDGLIDALSTELSTPSEDQAAASAAGGDYATDAYAGSSWFTDQSSDFTYQDLPSSLPLVEDGSQYVVEMDATLWDALADFQVNVMEEYNGGYLMLGSDNVWDTTADDNIIVDYDGTWTSLGGERVAFYGDAPTAQSDGEYSFSGTIPALLNDTTRIDVVVYYPPMSQQGDRTVGYVQGWRAHDMTASNLFGHGLSPFNEGDTITPLFDFYDASGTYQETLQGDPIAMQESNMPVSYESFGDAATYFWGTMTTVYGDAIDTEALSIE